METVQWLTGGLVLVLSSLGVAKIGELTIKRWYAARDGKANLSLASQIKQMETDERAFEYIFKELSTVNTRLNEIQSELNRQIVANAELKAQNTILTAENTRQEFEVTQLREEVKRLKVLIGEANGGHS